MPSHLPMVVTIRNGIFRFVPSIDTVPFLPANTLASKRLRLTGDDPDADATSNDADMDDA